MKKLFFAALLILPVLSHSQDVDHVTELLNSYPRSERIKKAAAGDREAASTEVRRFVDEYCWQTKKCHWISENEEELRGEVGVKFAKIYLKTIENANRRYAEALIELNKKISECQEEPSALFSNEPKESCSEEIICKGKKAEELRDLFSEFNSFEDKIGATQRELSEEEKMILGEDVSFLTKIPDEKKIKYGYTLDSAKPIFSMAPMLQTRNLNQNEKKMFSTKMESRVLKSVSFDDNDIPDGIMTLRALRCEDEKITKGESVKKDEFSCSLLVGNKSATDEKLMEMKRCLAKPEKDGFFASFKNMFSKKKESVEVNESERNKVKESSIQAPESQQMNSQTSER